MSNSHSLFRETPLRSPLAFRNPSYNFNHDSRFTPQKSYGLDQPDEYPNNREDVYGTNICVRKVLASI